MKRAQGPLFASRNNPDSRNGLGALFGMNGIYWHMRGELFTPSSPDHEGWLEEVSDYYKEGRLLTGLHDQCVWVCECHENDEAEAIAEMESDYRNGPVDCKSPTNEELADVPFLAVFFSQDGHAPVMISCHELCNENTVNTLLGDNEWLYIVLPFASDCEKWIKIMEEEYSP
jgi:hypothetical protein